MLSIKSIPAGDSAGRIAAYYEGYQLGAEDPDARQHDEPGGRWIGKFAQQRGFAGDFVQRGQLSAALQGFDPQTGEALSNNAGQEKHKPGYDLTFSSPKSVSILWAAADSDLQKRISAAQQAAVEKAIAHAEAIGAFHQREGHGGAVHIPHHAIAVATFEHSSNRAGEPHLHTHAVIPNISENGKRIDFDTRHAREIDAVYKIELARALQEMGIALDRDGPAFRAAAVPIELEKELSTRKAQIDERAAEKGMDSAAARDMHQLATREQKADNPRATAFAMAREAAQRAGFDPQAAIQPEAVQRKAFDSREFLSETFAQASTLSEPQLRARIIESAGLSGENADTALQRIDALRSTGDLVQLADHQTGETRYTSREMLDLERGIADTAGRMAAEQTHGTDARALEKAIASRTLSDDQKQALQHLAKPDRIAVVQGVAGAGKSYMLDAARETWERSGYQVVGAALAGKAAEGLEKSSGIKSETLHKTLSQLDSGDMTLSSKTVVVVDEAGMVGSRQMSRLLEHADHAGAKVVLVGDTRQLQPIDAGGAMRAIQERAGHAELNNIRRQQDPAQRDMVAAWAKGDAKQALERLENLGAFQTHESADQARQAIAQAIVQDMQAGKTSIALADTRREVQQVNTLAREQARAAGIVRGEDAVFQAERGERQFAQGDRLIFLKNDKQLGVKNGTTATVLQATENRLRVQLDDKTRDGKPQIVEFKQDRYSDVDHGYSFTVHKSQGVTIDRAHYQPGSMADLHSAYVACSRHRETVSIHGTAEQLEEFKRTSQREREKDVSADYKLTDPPPSREPQQERQPGQGAEREPQRIEGERYTAPQVQHEQPQRMQPLKEDRDMQLAKAALTTYELGHKIPCKKQIDRAIKRGEAHYTRDGEGRLYLQYKDKTFAPDLYKRAKGRAAGREKVVIVQEKLRIMGFKTNIRTGDSAVLIGRQTLLDKVKSRLTGKDYRHWERAGALRSLVERTRIALQNRADHKAALRDLQAVANRQPQQAQQQREQAQQPQRKTLLEQVQERIEATRSPRLSEAEMHKAVQAAREKAAELQSSRDPYRVMDGRALEGHAQHIQHLLEQPTPAGMSREGMLQWASSETKSMMETMQDIDRPRTIEVNIQPRDAGSDQGFEMGM